jgi:type 1 glutamine amidotransferase
MITRRLVLTALPGASLLRSQGLTSEEKKRVEDAVPKSAPAKPKKPRRILVSNLNVRRGTVRVGEREHPSIPYGNYAIELLGKRTGAYEAVFNNDIGLLRPGFIDQYDAICFNNTVGVLFDDKQLRESLLGFIAAGKGFVGFHAAAATFVEYPVYDQWPPFGRMVGGTENGGHPWRPNETITVKVADPNSPLTAMFKGTGFEIADEVYQFQEPDIAARIHPLLSIDLDKTDFGPNRRILPVRRNDRFFPLTWIKPHEQGRVFYSSLGHNAHVYSNPALLAHFLAGIQYALGDLKADDRPTPGSVTSGSSQ